MKFVESYLAIFTVEVQQLWLEFMVKQTVTI